jgi:putative sigma-54 modulation protein
MNIEYVGKHLTVTDKTKAFTEEKLGKLLPFVAEPVELRVVLDAEKKHTVAEVHVTHRFGTLVAKEESENLHEAIHDAVEKIVKQARRSRKKYMDKRRRDDRTVQEEHRWPVNVIEKASVGDGAVPNHRIIRSSHLTIKPMTIDEAALTLEGSKHGFVVFRDSGTDEVSVLYKRKDDNYGLVVAGP